MQEKSYTCDDTKEFNFRILNINELSDKRIIIFTRK